MRMILVAISLSVLAGCTEPQAPDAPATLPGEDACGASRFQNLVGQPKSVLDGVTLPEGNRVIGPNQPVTMDFRPTRLNVEIGKDGRIARVGCY
ncbi:I78 family peptidase inhibitor [Paracoccus sp. CPCC 101403]|uniref:I78 family peptidase inhibitor n=3 Tax=Paracoccus broussonetiae TaxID=3075834 RepID=A0ABU3EG08_9RHOB|nr:I78 family peptidase inhibitor [Paracoccus sp. CPCC 101403]